MWREQVLKKCMKFLAGIVSVSLFMSFLSFNSAVAEDRISSMRNQIKELEKQQKSLNAKLSGLKDDINKKKDYRATILEQMNTLQGQIDLENEKIDTLNQEIESKQSQIDEVQKEISSKTADLGERLKAIYKAGDVPELAIFLNVKNFDDLLDKADVIQKLSKHDAELIGELNGKISQVEQEESEIKQNKEEVESAKGVLEEKRKDLNNLREENERAISYLQSQESSVRKQISSNDAQQRSLQNKISRSTNRPQIYSKGRYIWPVPGHSRISSGWGGARRHNGIDIAAPKGTTIVAAADGVVVAANATNSWGSGWGYYVRISHGNGYETIYAHLSKVSARVGQSVKAGQKIGEMGSTGRSTGSHLHFGTSKNGKWYNPRTEV